MPTGDQLKFNLELDDRNLIHEEDIFFEKEEAEETAAP